MNWERTLTCQSFKNRNITVMGLGRFGGGVAVTRFLVKQGARVTLTDLATETELSESLSALEPFPPARLVLGKHDEADFTRADALVVNPAVKPDHLLLQLARTAGIPLTSEMNLFWQLQRGKTMAITGSNGKSTTTAMIHAILQETGQTVRLGGNIGKSLLEEVEEIQPDDWTVLELSSFQLYDLDRLQPKPDGAVVTNFTPNHLDWHGNLEHYRTAKQTLIRWQTPEQTAVLNADDPEVSRWPTNARRLEFGEHDLGGNGVFAISEKPTDWRVRIGEIEEIIPLSNWLNVPGRHNQQNAAAAIAASLSAGATLLQAKRALGKFTGLPHRLELVADICGRRFYDDSIATTPESVAVALAAFSEPIVLLAGGYNKGIDLLDMARKMAKRIKAVALLGTTGPMLKTHLQAQNFPEQCMRVCQSLEEAVRWAGEQSAAGDVLLLSPGCASYDWFRNFADRGEQFARLVKSWNPVELSG